MPAITEIFSNVPKQDYLSFKGQPNRIAEFLDFKKDDIAKATGVPLSSIRYDEKMPTELRDRLREWDTLLNLVAEHFKGDKEKTALWFTTLNPLLGNIAPRDMIRFGRYKKLFKFVLNAISENRR
jgi:hypothetical protein